MVDVVLGPNFKPSWWSELDERTSKKCYYRSVLKKTVNSIIMLSKLLSIPFIGKCFVNAYPLKYIHTDSLRYKEKDLENTFLTNHNSRRVSKCLHWNSPFPNLAIFLLVWQIKLWAI